MHYKEAIKQGLVTVKELLDRMPLFLCGNHGERLARERMEQLIQVIWEGMEKEATNATDATDKA